MNRHWSRPRPVAGGTEQNHVAMDGVECGAEKPSLESEILVINTVENMVPLFNRLTEQAYLTNAEHAEFIRLYKFLATHLSAAQSRLNRSDPVRVTRPRTARPRIAPSIRTDRVRR